MMFSTRFKVGISSKDWLMIPRFAPLHKASLSSFKAWIEMEGDGDSSPTQ